MSERTIWYVVADLNQPSLMPFAVLRVDTSIKSGKGVKGTVVSLHSLREQAERVVHEFNEVALS